MKKLSLVVVSLFLASTLAVPLVACTPGEQATGSKVYDVVRRVRDLVCAVPLPAPTPTAAPAPSK